MSERVTAGGSKSTGFREFLIFLRSELKPRGPLLTPFNVISIPVILLGLVLITIRFALGLGSVSNLSQEFPWGMWIGFDVVTGVAFAGGAYVLTCLVYIFGATKYKPIVRATVLNGFLAYVFYAGALLLDLGRPWNVVNPIIGNAFGVSSVLFLVAWHFLLYMLAQFLEFSPAVAEWMGARRARKILASMTLGAVILGITLSTLHQSGLGALFLTARSKIHPLWYTEFIPLLFFVSSIYAGLSMVIFEGSISHRVFSHRLDEGAGKEFNEILVGLARICSGALFVYLFLKLLVLVHDQHWSLLGTGMGAWFLLEVLGFGLVPCILFLLAARGRRLKLIRIASLLAMLGIILNRLNISVIAFRWDSAAHYVPSWQEIEITLAIICMEIWVFRWVVLRMPVMGKRPDWAKGDHEEGV